MDTTARSFHIKPETSPERRDFYQRLDKRSTAPLWEVLAQIVLPEPRPASVPALWRYDEIRPLLMESGRLITAKEAERRVLVLENPGLRGASRITQSLYAGLQLILPGEVADSHRHVASALRFVIEGEGAYTAVDGERATMHPGDFILTPSWTYHDHGNPGETAVVWMDGLDIPIVNMFDTSFAEHHPEEETQPVSRTEERALGRGGTDLAPVEHTANSVSAPAFSYPYARSRETLERLYRNGRLHPCHGIRLQYATPTTGRYPMPTLAAFLQLLPAGFRGAACRSTDATVYCIAEGRGRTTIGNGSFDWKEHDIFVAPSWCSVVHEAHEDAVLFSFSDRPAQKALGLWREEAPIAA